jgi:hypothetical protein
MMDANKGDHNCFSKWMLDWITPVFIPQCQRPATLRAAGDYPDAVMVFPQANGSDLFSEYFMVQNRFRTGNDNTLAMPGNGLLIWHVDATLNPAGTNFLYNNSYTARKLLRLMETDGLEEIETGTAANADDYYVNGDAFGPSSLPSNSLYSGVPSGVEVWNISAAGLSMTASFSALADCWRADGTGLSQFIADYGRVDCTGDCFGDFNADGDVYEEDLAYFATIFGK